MYIISLKKTALIIPLFAMNMLFTACYVGNEKAARALYYGNYDNAHAIYEESLDLNRKMHNSSGTAYQLSMIANIYKNTGQYDKALLYYEESLKINSDLNSARRCTVGCCKLMGSGV